MKGRAIDQNESLFSLMDRVVTAYRQSKGDKDGKLRISRKHFIQDFQIVMPGIRKLNFCMGYRAKFVDSGMARVTMHGRCSMSGQRIEVHCDRGRSPSVSLACECGASHG